MAPVGFISDLVEVLVEDMNGNHFYSGMAVENGSPLEKNGPVRFSWIFIGDVGGEFDEEGARYEWVENYKDGALRYVRIISDRAAVIHVSPRSSGQVIHELMEALPNLSAEMEDLERAWRGLVETWREVGLEFSVDGWVSVPYGPLTWFHGQDSVNELLSGTGLELMEDYDGVTRVRAYSGRPFTADSLSRALRLLTIGIRMYSAIKSVQEGEAVKVTLFMLPLLVRSDEALLGGGKFEDGREP